MSAFGELYRKDVRARVEYDGTDFVFGACVCVCVCVCTRTVYTLRSVGAAHNRYPLPAHTVVFILQAAVYFTPRMHTCAHLHMLY